MIEHTIFQVHPSEGGMQKANKVTIDEKIPTCEPYASHKFLSLKGTFENFDLNILNLSLL